MLSALVVAALALALVNGANDNFKGVATLHGSGVLSFRPALVLATLTTLAGSLLSIVLARGLVKAFSAKGLVPQEVLDPAFLTAVALGATCAVLAATIAGLPISTTHALLGGLVGAGLVRAGGSLQVGVLASVFALPLVVSPVLSMALAAGLSRGGAAVARGAGVTGEACVCVGTEWVVIGGPEALAAHALTAKVGTVTDCRVTYDGTMVGVTAERAATVGHLTSAGLVGFARGLNDTPKILGLLVGAGAVAAVPGALLVGTAMAVGGLVGSRRVAETMAKKLTPMTPGQGLAGNVATSFLVMAASRFGLPVSTTHVATGGILGIGAASGGLRKGAAATVLLAWLVTLPVAAIAAALLALLLR